MNIGYKLDKVYAQASCTDESVDPEWWFSEAEEQFAKQICLKCPVAVECLQVAVEDKIRDGIWGGFNPDERAKLAKKR